MPQLNRPIALSIAGFDPSGGAGLLADIKTIEQHKVYGLGIVSALTFQTEDEFFSLNWRPEKEIETQLKVFLTRYPIKVVKFGIVKNWKTTHTLVNLIKGHNKNIKIIIDPILKTTTGYNISNRPDENMFLQVLRQIDLLTPNCNEAAILANNKSAEEAGRILSQYCNIFLKGGHNKVNLGIDYLFDGIDVHKIGPVAAKVYPKHGSGCALSAAIASNVALGKNIKESCVLAKRYTEKFLKSNKSLIGYHA